jgi:hypothetical protein
LYPLYNIFGSISVHISSAVLYRCETLSQTLREEHRLRVIENRVLRKEYLDPRRMK